MSKTKEVDMPWTPVQSSNLAAVRYTADEKWLDVQFHSDRPYRYNNVPLTVFEELLEAESKGKFFNAVIKNKYTFVELEEHEV